MSMQKYIYAGASSLQEFKNAKNKAIDQKTVELISQGFAFDSNTFSLSIPAQMNWNAIYDNPSDFLFPLPISTIDNLEYPLAESNVSAFWQAGRDILKGHYDSGRALKQQVNQCSSIDEVKAIQDNR